MRRRVILIGFAAVLLAVVGVASMPVAAQELSVSDVEVPNSVTADESFDVEVDVAAEDVEDVDVVLGLPEQLSCSPSGSQSVSLDDGSGTVTFSCEASAPGDYAGDIDVTTAGTTTDGNSISDSTQTGLLVSSPASLSLTDSLGADIVDEGDSTTLTVSVDNTGDVSTSYELSVSSDPGLSHSLDSGSPDDSIDGGDTAFVTYALTGETDGDHDATVTLTGDNGQEITATETVTVTESGGSGAGGGGSSGGTTSASASTAEPTVIDDPEELRETVDLPEDVEPTRAERAPITVDEGADRARVTFSEASTTESIVFEDDDVDGEVTVAEYESEPETTGPSPGASVSVTQIEVPDSDRAATIRTRVSTDRLEEIGADAEDLRVNRFNEELGEWQGLPTDLVGSDDGYVVLEAETPGFSLFSVSATSEPEAAIDAPAEITAGEEVTLDASDSSDEYGEIVAYEWTIDGETLTGETVTTALEAPDDYQLTLTVENDAGEIDTETTTLSAAEGDAAEGDTDDAGDSESDGDDGSEPASDDVADSEEQDGFGPTIAIVALLGALLLARGRT